MKSVTNLIRSVFTACLATLWCSSPVWGDDTEIFFGDLEATGVRPNVLFIIDTSGSMSGAVNDIGDRLDNVEAGMFQLLDELSNVNVGLMRFTNPGGPVLFPVTDIDAEANVGQIVTTVTRVRASADDAMEIVGTGQMVLDSNRLEFVDFAADLITFQDQVNDGNDDTEEFVDGGAIDFLGSAELDVDIARRIGVRFSGSSVPVGATITNAYLRFTSRNGGDSNPLGFRIYGQVQDTGEFADGTTFDVRDRADTTAFVDWAIPGLLVGETADTPDLSAIVQEIVNDAQWDPSDSALEDDMVFVLEPQPGETSTATRKFSSRNEGTTVAPQLYIEYYVGTPPTDELARGGLRFDVADIPRGATITDAYISFTAERDSLSTHDLTIDIEATGDAAAYSSTAGDIGGRTTTGSPVTWAGTEDLSSGDNFETPKLTSLVQAVVNRNDWCGGNAMGFVIDGTVGDIPVWSFDGDPSLAPRLTIKYDYDSITPGASCIRRTISRSVTASSDDAEENGANVTTVSLPLEIDAGNVVGVRIGNVDIPQNATIFSANLNLTSGAASTGAAGLNIQIESTDDADVYVSSDGAIEGRSYAATNVPWNITNDWSDGRSYRSPDLTALVSAVTSRSGWEVGNALAFRLDQTSGYRVFDSVNANPAESPRLEVTFEDDGSGLAERTTREVMKELISGLNHNGWTPVQDTLYEAALYYTGGNVQWGASRGAADDGGPYDYTRVSDEQSMVAGSYSINRPPGCDESDLGDSACRFETITAVGSGPTYNSPIDDACQKQSHIIMLTDGAANRPHSATLIPNFIGEACLNEDTLNDDGTFSTLSSGEQCVKDLARYMNENDMAPTLLGDQIITTHTIGFNFSSNWLEDVADAGGGSYKTAGNAAELKEEIEEIIRDVMSTDTTFVAPVAAVNQFNQLNHLSQVYVAVFRPEETPRWPGNVKRYQLGEGGEFFDANGASAVDPATGFFLGTAQSFWSTGVDGGVVDEGGAAEQTPNHTSRNVYTYVAGSTSTNLANSVNSLVNTNTSLLPSMFDATAMSTAEFNAHIDWVRGKDVDDEDGDSNVDENRYLFGDPLHSRPVAVTYGDSETQPDVELFFGTNAGAIQSVDADTGIETFAFFPEATLPIQIDLRENEPTTQHPYGVDGTPTAWTNDEARDGINPAQAEDFVRVYIGMRRGGRNYYALDATDRTNPEVMWQILGGSVQANGDDFSELGQSWSRPIKTQVILSGDTEPRDVLLFSAGYDAAQDDAQVQTPDNMGRGMYMVDAVTGRLLWSGGKTGAQAWTESFSNMDYSFPSNLSVVDINLDGLADMWFVADTGGRLWRFDIANGESLANLVTGGVIADLGVASGPNEIANNRRFFAQPSVALVRGPDGPELAIAIGSGSRPSPLSVLATNRMHLIRQQAVFSAPASYIAITESDLYDATANTLATAEGTELSNEQALLYESQGWFFDFGLAGEKSITSPLIADDRVVFATYTPGDTGQSCNPVAGTSRGYSVRLEDAVRAEPRPLVTNSPPEIAVFVAGDAGLDPNQVDDPNEIPDPNEPPGSACPNGNEVVIKLNLEDGGLDTWCNTANKTYWVKEQ